MLAKNECTVSEKHTYPKILKFFTVYTKLVEMAGLASKDLTTAKKLPPVGLDLMQEIITGFRVQCLTN